MVWAAMAPPEGSVTGGTVGHTGGDLYVAGMEHSIVNMRMAHSAPLADLNMKKNTVK